MVGHVPGKRPHFIRYAWQKVKTLRKYMCLEGLTSGYNLMVGPAVVD